MFLFFHFGEGELQVIDVFLQLRTLVLQLPLLRCQLSIDFLLILQPLGRLFEFGLELDLCFDEPLTPFLCIAEVFTFLKGNANKLVSQATKGRPDGLSYRLHLQH